MAPFIPLIDPSSPPLIASLAVLGPLLIPSGLLRAVLSTLPAGKSYYVLVEEGEDIISILDAGASRVIVSAAQAEEVRSSVSGDRLIVRSDGGGDAKGYAGLFYSGATPPEKISGDLEILYQSTSTSPSDILEMTKSRPDLTPVVPSTLLTSSSTTTSHLSISDLLLARLVSDRPDGLFPTVVTSATNHRSLGLVYSSAESIAETIKTGRGVYQSRKHGLWRKGETSGATQEIVSIRADCDTDALLYEVIQHGSGFCHLPQPTCFGELSGLAKLESTLTSRMAQAPEGSYTKRLFTDEKLLRAKVLEEAQELCDAESKEEVAFEMADLVYFALARCVSKGVSMADVERALDAKSLKVSRRQGDAKSAFEAKTVTPSSKPTEPVPSSFPTATPSSEPPIKMRSVTLSNLSTAETKALLLRPVLNSLSMIDKVKPIVARVRTEGDAGLKAMTKQFDKADLTSNILLPPFATPSADVLSPNVREAIDAAYENVRKFHAAQVDGKVLEVETMPGIVCSRFARPIARVGIYVPGGTAVLPSTAIMLGVPAQVAGCKEIVLATPPRPDGSISPEVLYVAKLAGVTCILKAGGAQAVAAMAYGTDEVPKVDKIFGPGNQWVTAAKMLVQNDTDALVGIDMPAGPSEVLVIADKSANPVFVASDLLSQAEHGTDSQVVLVAIDLSDSLLREIELQIDEQARALPRVAIAKEAIKKSIIVKVGTLQEGMAFSNEYAPEHLILHLEDSKGAVGQVENAGSVFVGAFSPESCGDYASGTNHTLPTNGFARQFSGVNTLSFQKHITSQELTKEGLKRLGPVVITLAEREGLEAHANAVRVRLAAMDRE
ncbi:histidinol dehydrogenase [Dioszegia hungarica]|uniref:Histidine biosynthesis trifunctional protein n=1 Tax=Dioszegia hungarica TaxID=4972 RepID=A0AA38LQQ3_9TREE|nr:histidinol dehydrogenase [Dioszegia hungarica]KAI9631828.1 histidinol dehydrogenase [Dioszegia hungarica]